MNLIPSNMLRAASLALALSCTNAAHAHTPEQAMSEASALSALPVAVSVTAPSVILSTGVVLTVVAVEVVAGTTVWVLARASDGARVVIRWGSQAVGVASMAIGTAVTVTAISAGQVLSAAGQVIAFVPNALGASLLYNERLPD